MQQVLQLVIVAFATFLASSGGFWMYLKTRVQDKDKAEAATTRLLIGLARDRILSLGFVYLARGWVSHDEYQNLSRYLVEPYAELTSDVTVHRLMEAIETLQFRPGPAYTNEEKTEAAAATVKMADRRLTSEVDRQFPGSDQDRGGK